MNVNSNQIVPYKYDDSADIENESNEMAKNNKKRKRRVPIRRKKNIPASLKSAVWCQYNGKKFEAKCHVKWCGTIVNVFNFEAGHDIPESKGGMTNIDNLRPICALCNKSMSNNFSIQEFSKKFENKKCKTGCVNFWPFKFFRI